MPVVNTELIKTDVLLLMTNKIYRHSGCHKTKAELRWKGVTNPVEVKCPTLMNWKCAQSRLLSSGALLVFIGAQFSKDALIEAISLGVSAVIEKPFRECEVIEEVTQTIYQAELNVFLNRGLEVMIF